MLNYSDRSVVFPFTLSFESMTSMCLYLNFLKVPESQGYVLLSASVSEEAKIE